MRRVLIMVLAFSTAFGCGRAPAPQPDRPGSRVSATDTGFASRAPENTRLLGRIDVSSPPWHTRFWEIIDAGQAGARRASGRAISLAQCGIDRNTAVDVIEVAVAEPFRVLVELRGTVSARAIGCLFGVDTGVVDLNLGGFVVTDLPAGGVRFANYRRTAGTGAPRALQRRFQSLIAADRVTIVASVGADAERIEVSFVHDQSVTRFDILVPDSQQAGAAHAWLVEAMAHAATKDRRVSRVTIRRHGGRLIIESPPWDASLPPGDATLIDTSQVLQSSMFPTLEQGDYCFIAKGPLAGTAARGDVIVFQVPDADMPYVKRVIGVGGDRIALKSGELRLNGERVPARKVQDDYNVMDVDPVTGEPFIAKGVLWTESLDGREYQIVTMYDMTGSPDGEWIVPDDHVFVLGDNRDISMDSRSFGAIPSSSILGHVVVLWMSMGPSGIRWDRIGRVIR